MKLSTQKRNALKAALIAIESNSEMSKTQILTELKINGSSFRGYVTGTTKPQWKKFNSLVEIINSDIFKDIVPNKCLSKLTKVKDSKKNKPRKSSRQRGRILTDSERNVWVMIVDALAVKERPNTFLEEKCGLAASTSSQYVTGKMTPRLNNLIKIASVISSDEEVMENIPKEYHETIKGWVKEKEEKSAYTKKKSILRKDVQYPYVASEEKQAIRVRNIRFAAQQLTGGYDNFNQISKWMEVVGEGHPTISNILNMGILPPEKIIGIDLDWKIVKELHHDHPEVFTICGDIKDFLSCNQIAIQVFNLDVCYSISDGGHFHNILKQFGKTVPSILSIQEKIVVMITVCASGTARADGKKGITYDDYNQAITDRIMSCFPIPCTMHEVERYKCNSTSTPMLQYRLVFQQ